MRFASSLDMQPVNFHAVGAAEPPLELGPFATSLFKRPLPECKVWDLGDRFETNEEYEALKRRFVSDVDTTKMIAEATEMLAFINEDVIKVLTIKSPVTERNEYLEFVHDYFNAAPRWLRWLFHLFSKGEPPKWE